MDIDSIKTVIAVAKLKSFSQAAYELPCAQSTVSRRIKMVEDELQIQIFMRPTKQGTVSLTVEGEKVVPILQSMLEDYERLLRLSGGESGISSIKLAIPGHSTLPPMGIHYLSTSFFLKHPNIEFSIVDSSETDMIERLGLRRVEAAILAQYNWRNTTPFTYLECNEMLRVQQIGSQNVYVAISERNPLASQNGLMMTDLKKLGFLYTRDISAMPATQLLPNHIMFLEACRRSGFTPKIALMGNKNRAIRYSLVEQGLGVMLSSLPERLRYYEGVSFLPIKDCPMYAVWYLITRKDANPQIHQIMSEFLGELFAEDKSHDINKSRGLS